MGNALQTLFIAQLHVADQMFCEMLRQLTDNIATLQSAQLKHFVSTTGSNSYGTEINSEKASHLPAVKIEYTFLYIRKNFLYLTGKTKAFLKAQCNTVQTHFARQCDGSCDNYQHPIADCSRLPKSGQQHGVCL